jgi:radical SAM superfamily enzyme YgiQ (UPF0313 family)
VIGVSVQHRRPVPGEFRFLLARAGEVVGACRACSAAPIVLGGAGHSIFQAALSPAPTSASPAWRVAPALPPAARRRSAGLPGVVVPGGGPPAGSRDLDDLPLWDEALEAGVDRSAADLWVPVQSRRGCPNDCSYCSTARVQGRTIRARSPRLVAETVGRLGRLGYRRFFFVDNSFNIPEAHALELCCHLAGLDPRPAWRCILYPPRGEELAPPWPRPAASISPRFNRVPRSSEMNKRFLPEDVRAAVALLKAHRIRCMGFLLLGGPGETRESVEASLEFAASLGLDALRVTVGLRIYPGTPLARRAIADGVIASEEDLLQPRFYLAPGLEPWIHERLAGTR